MYKVFFNDRTVLLTDDFMTNFQLRYGLFYKFRTVEDLKELILFYRKLKRIDTLFIFHYELDVLRDSFRSCFKMIDAAGGLVFNRHSECLVMKRREKWDLPKGKLNKGESFELAALREVREETGLDGLVITTPLLSTYHAYVVDEEPYLKRTMWFDMYYAGESDPIPQQDEDITEVRWFQKSKLSVIQDNTYLSVLDVLKYADLL